MSVSLVCMPWHALAVPAIQVGLLGSLLSKAGIAHRDHYLYLDFFDFLARSGPGQRPLLQLEDYQQIGDRWFLHSPGEWAFALPPIRAADPVRDRRFLKRLQRAGLPRRLLDRLQAVRRRVPAFLEQHAERILDSGARVVGFTTTFGQMLASLALAARLKERDPAVRIVFGGAGCEGPMGEAVLKSFEPVDVVVRGEGEPVLVELVQRLLCGEPPPPLPGLCYRQQGVPLAVPERAATVVLDDQPSPDYDPYFERLQTSTVADRVVPVLPFESSRGCWWGEKSHCTFCGLNGATMTHRSKSPDRAARELTGLASRYGVLDFTVVDNILDMEYFSSLLPALRRRRVDLRLFYQTKANLGLDHIRLLRDAGVRTIRPGIESLSTPALRRMRKGVSALQNLRLLKWCAEHGIHVAWSVLYGLPGEEPAEYQHMADLVPSLVHLSPPSLSPLTVDRFSPYFEQAEQHGIEIVGAPEHHRLLLDLEDDRLQEMAWTFAFSVRGRGDPEAYTAGLRERVLQWRLDYHRNRGALTVRQGPGFAVIEDQRTTLGWRRFVLDELEAAVYIACDGGCRARTAATALGADEAAVAGILRELVAERLVYEEDGVYLSLALCERRLAGVGGFEPAAPAAASACSSVA